MQTIADIFAHVPDEHLLVEAQTLAAKERTVTAQLIASLGEIEGRGLFRRRRR